MKRPFFYLLAVCLCSSVVMLSGCRSTKVLNITSARFALESKTLQEKTDALMTILKYYRWVPTLVKPGEIDATMLARRGSLSATVKVKYDTKTFSITRVTSDGFSYNPATNTINRRYNLWVHRLEPILMNAEALIERLHLSGRLPK